jgi:hypothetical protein
MLELLDQLVCKTHGPACVVSDRAVYDLDLKHFTLPARVGKL